VTVPRTSAIFSDLSIPIKDLVIAVKGAGEMATGIACCLFKANIKQIFMMEIENPLAVRRQVSFCEAIHNDTINVEDVAARKANDQYHIPSIWQNKEIPVLVDPFWNVIEEIHPHVVIDAIIAKKNIGTKIVDAPLVIGLGPGFHAGRDVDLVIETNRGHDLGRIIAKGSAQANTGVPGVICGVSRERVLRAPCSGVFKTNLSIGQLIKKDQIIGHVAGSPVSAQTGGMLRGLIRGGTIVESGLKIGDIDPRGENAVHNTISEKARIIGGAVIESILRKYNC
jgi:xanthine dehydrogenase accessory factor